MFLLKKSKWDRIVEDRKTNSIFRFLPNQRLEFVHFSQFCNSENLRKKQKLQLLKLVHKNLSMVFTLKHKWEFWKPNQVTNLYFTDFYSPLFPILSSDLDKIKERKKTANTQAAPQEMASGVSIKKQTEMEILKTRSKYYFLLYRLLDFISCFPACQVRLIKSKKKKQLLFSVSIKRKINWNQVKIRKSKLIYWFLLYRL